MIHHGDMFDVLPTFIADSFDACVTDGPYGLGFMGREWDTFAPSAGEARIIKNDEIDSENLNVRGRKRGPASSPSAVEYDRSLRGQRAFQEFCANWGREVFRVLKPGAYVLSCGAPRSYHRMACGLEDAGFEVRDCFSWLFGQGFPKSLNLGDGRGTALKPGHEPIVLARKPFKGSVTANVERFGTGALNIDACRIEHDASVNLEARQRQQARHDGSDNWRMKVGHEQATYAPGGRWPANVLLDEEAAAILDEQSGECSSGDAHVLRRGGTTGRGMGYGSSAAGNVLNATYGDSGGASRFFYIAKPSRAERESGCHDLTPAQRDESRKPGNPGGDNPRNRGLQLRGNIHPTVKPVELMRWLVKLVTPPSGIVLDPFTGSGTTGMACAYEQRQFIGIEREAEYVEIAKRRIASVAPLFTEASA
jgi:DNA modification methylase